MMDAVDRTNGSRDSSAKLVCVPCLGERTPVKPPNKKKHEQHLSEINHTIDLKEKERKALLDYIRIDREQLVKIRSKKDEINLRKNSVFGDLDKINKEVQKKGEKVQKLRGGIVYPTETEIEQQVRKLMYQIQRNNFKLAEEKRIVCEIDRLNRSKKILREYLLLKEESDSLRSQQRALRDERESLFRELRDLRKQEDLLRANIRENSSKIDSLKEDIDHFYEELRTLVKAFRESDNEYRAYQRQRREELKKKLSEERAQKEAEDKKEAEALRALAEPYSEEQTLCGLLIKYCGSLIGSVGEVEGKVPDSNLLLLPSTAARRRSSGFSAYTPSSECSSRYATPIGCSPATTPVNGTPPTSLEASQPGFYKKKEDNGPVFFSGSKKKTKKSRTERRMSLKKCLSHNPETFLQFSLVNLTPPATLGEVHTVVELLKTKQRLYQKLAAEEKEMRAPAKANVKSCPVIIVDPVAVSRSSLTLNLPNVVLPEVNKEHEPTDCDPTPSQQHFVNLTSTDPSGTASLQSKSPEPLKGPPLIQISTSYTVTQPRSLDDSHFNKGTESKLCDDDDFEFDAEMKLSQSQFLPKDDSKTRADTELAPTNGAETRAETELAPTIGAETRVDTESSPTICAKSRADTELAPTNGAETGAETELSPTVSTETRVKTKLSTTNGAETRAETEFAPTNGAETSAKMEFVPTNGAVTRTETEFAPTNSSETRAETEFAPTNSSETWAETEFAPTNGAETRGETDIFPINYGEAGAERELKPSKGTEPGEETEQKLAKDVVQSDVDPMKYNEYESRYLHGGKETSTAQKLNGK